MSTEAHQENSLVVFLCHLNVICYWPTRSMEDWWHGRTRTIRGSWDPPRFALPFAGLLRFLALPGRFSCWEVTDVGELRFLQHAPTRRRGS